MDFGVPLRPIQSSLGTPFVSGFTEGRAIYGYSDGAKSEIHVVDPVAQTDELIFSTMDIVHHAVLSADGSMVFFVPVDRLTGANNGIWALPNSPGAAAPKRIGAPADQDGGERAFQRLYVSPRGDDLLVRTCTSSRCRLSSLETLVGVSRALIETPSGDWVGRTDTHAVFGTGCSSACGWSVLDIPDGTVHEIGSQDGTSALAEDARGALLAWEARRGPTLSVRAAHLVGDEAADVLVESLDDLGIVSVSDEFVVDLPRSFILLGPDGSPTGANARRTDATVPYPSVVRLTDGLVVPINDLGTG